jgi:hypothetical protein
LKSSLIVSTLVLVFILVLFSAKSASAAGEYWFQVGVIMESATSVDVTGASVQIMTHYLPPQGLARFAFWVGLNLPNDAFIQVGYANWPEKSGPQRFWEYFPPNTANQGSSAFLGDYYGWPVGPNGTWWTYSLQSYGDVWSAYIDGVIDGSVNLGASSSGGNPYALYAFAEVSHVYSTNIPLGPVEFRDLAYRDTSNVWHNVSEGLASMGYGAGSAIGPTGASFPYGLEVLGVNDWIVGSGLPSTLNYTTIWSGSAVIPEFPTTSTISVIISIASTLVIASRGRKRVSVSVA